MKQPEAGSRKLEAQTRTDSLELATSSLQLPPLAAYIHIPWCVKKCPYCDFNSHTSHDTLPEAEYVDALIEDLEQDLQALEGLPARPLTSIFFGGGP